MIGCLLVDSDTVARWQYEALELAVQQGLSISCVLICDNVRAPRRRLRHAGYYGLRVTSMRHKWTRRMSWHTAVSPDVTIIHFQAEDVGMWQRVPEDILGRLASFELDVVIKFGMGLLRDPQTLPATHGVLSFHHGDPAAYRGRPAGFWEVLHAADHMGVMVQRLSNRLDAGVVLAYASCKLSMHSYKQTLETAYNHSIWLLAKALRNAQRGRTADISTSGRNYTVPTNRVVGLLLLRLLLRKGRRLAYGALLEKRWRVAYAAGIDIGTVSDGTRLEVLDELAPPRGYRFIADPAVFDAETILCEGLHRASGLGHLLAVTRAGAARIDTSAIGNGHLSYPHVVRHEGRTYVLPEMATVGPQVLLEVDSRLVVRSVIPLAGLDGARLIDPTLFHHDQRWWLFAGPPTSASDVLCMWMASALTGPYQEHPDSPIVMDPSRARPAGPIQVVDGRVFRPGQDNRSAYGSGVTISQITTLSVDDYAEHVVGRLGLARGRGPHTMNLLSDRSLVDVYDDVVNPMAWFVRLRARARR